MRLIDADELVRNIDELSKDAGFYKPIYEWFSRRIKDSPTIDAVPVVRCKDCKRFAYDKSDADYYCEISACVVAHNDFCSYGKRKDGDTNG